MPHADERELQSRHKADSYYLVVMMHFPVVMHFLIVISLPRTHSGTDNDRVEVCPHSVLNIRWNQNKASNWVSLSSFLVELWPDGNLETFPNRSRR